MPRGFGSGGFRGGGFGMRRGGMPLLGMDGMGMGMGMGLGPLLSGLMGGGLGYLVGRNTGLQQPSQQMQQVDPAYQQQPPQQWNQLTPAQPQSAEVLSQLKLLGELYDKNVLTDEEFAIEKERILGR